MSSIIAAQNSTIGGQPVIVLTTYICTDEGDYPTEIQAETAQEAAEAFVADADWPTEPKTYWISVNVREATDEDGDEEESHRVAIEPMEPDCTEEAHEYRGEGVRGHGGGVITTEACIHCGLQMFTDTWAQCRETGQQGLTSTEYRTESGF